MKLFSNLKGDLMGGIATSVIALPGRLRLASWRLRQT